jgi:putative oxidoreductase
MTNAQWAMHDSHISLPLADRVLGGREIWLLGRVVLGGLFLISGIEKLVALDAFAATLMKGGISGDIATVLAPIAAIAETLGGFVVLIGFATSWASLLMFVFTIVAAFISHRFWELQGDMAQMQQAHFMKNMMIAGAFCLLYVAGGGPCSIDRWQRTR